MLPDEQASEKLGVMDKTVAEVLAGKNLHGKKPLGVALEVYEATPVFISVDITEEVVKPVAQKKQGGAGTGGTDL